MEKITRFMKEEEGAHAIEYGLIASLIAVAIIVGATTLGGKLNTLLPTLRARSRHQSRLIRRGHARPSGERVPQFKRGFDGL